jgi:uncharacterized protein
MSSKHEIERRVAGGSVSSTDLSTISGYASVVDEPYSVGEFVEVIGEGAFDKVMAGNPDIRLLFNHDANHILARTKSGTLFVAANEKGLCFSGKVADTQAGRDCLTLVARRDLAECSFSFSVGKGMDSWADKTDNDGKPYVLRTINDFAEIFDVSVVTYPASSATSCDARHVLPDAVLAEARSHGAKPFGRISVSKLQHKPYMPMTEEEIRAAAHEQVRTKGFPLGLSPTEADRFLIRHRANDPNAVR